MLGQIRISDLRVVCVIGVHPHERQRPQPLRLDLELTRDFAQAAASDDVRHTTDYSEVAAAITELLQERRFRLLETLAVEGCQLVLARWPEVQRCALHVKKASALPQAAHAAVRLELSRG